MGARELTTVADVDATLGDQQGTMLVFVNSVCGCAAGNARPALRWRWSTRSAPAGRHRVRGTGSRGDGTGPAVLRRVSAEQPLDGAAAGRRGGAFRSPAPDRGPLPQSIAGDLAAAFDQHFGAGAVAERARLPSRPSRAPWRHGRGGDGRAADLRRPVRHRGRGRRPSARRRCARCRDGWRPGRISCGGARDSACVPTGSIWWCRSPKSLGSLRWAAIGA